MKIRLLWLVVACVGFSAHASASQCPAINCDCSGLPSDSWKAACESHEAAIKKSCAANSNVPKDFCSVHGPAAKPLALDIEFSEFKMDAAEDVQPLNEKVASVYWAVYADSATAKEAFDEQSYARTMQIFKLVDSNITQLFEIQQKAGALLTAKGDPEVVKKTWRKYGEDSKKFAERLDELGSEIAARLETAQTKKQTKIFTVLSQKAFRMAGKGYEQSGYALGLAGRHKHAARAWQASSRITNTLIEMDKKAGVKDGLAYMEFQAAARLFRASYHWMLNEDPKDSIIALEKAQDYVGHDEQKNIETLITSEKAAQEEKGLFKGIITGR